MPEYCYTDEAGETVTKVFRMGEAPETVRIDCVTYVRDYRAECKAAAATEAYPRFSDSMGQTPATVKETAERLRRGGVPTEFKPAPGGCYQAVVTSRGHEKKLRKALGMTNFDDY